MRSPNFRSGTGTSSFPGDFPVKNELEDSVADANATRNKRTKYASTFEEQWSGGSNDFPIPPAQYNPLDEPSPLGLRLRKSPSLLELIQMKLSHGNADATLFDSSLNKNTCLIEKKDGKGNPSSVTTDKLKASNFSASLLRIGRWEYVSRYEGDLVAKCYYAKHKLVWEILDGGLKSKIEIQWSDISALNANCPDNGPGTLIVVLARKPLFFRETNPQPRKHTLWQASADFTDGEASLHRQHYLQCPQGLLNKHYEKLIQCDARLSLLSRQPELVLDSPYFDARDSDYDDQDNFNRFGTAKGSPISGITDLGTTSTSHSSSSKMELQDSHGTVSEDISGYLSQAPSPSSELKSCESLKVPGLRPSMSMSDLVDHIEHCISEQAASGNPLSEQAIGCQDMLKNIANVLLSDTQLPTASDEKSLMSRVNSLCCLLEAGPDSAERGGSHSKGPHKDGNAVQLSRAPNTVPHEDKVSGVAEAPEGDVGGSKQASTMSRKDSLVDLLSSLPRIASLPRMLFDISECKSFK